MGSKRQRQADRALVAAYHEARLGELFDLVAAAIDGFRAGERDAYEVDETIHQYHRAARELWKFCWRGRGRGRRRAPPGCCKTRPPRASRSTGGNGERHVSAVGAGRASRVVEEGWWRAEVELLSGLDWEAPSLPGPDPGRPRARLARRARPRH